MDIRDITLTKKQYAALTTDANEILYGGSAGSGKFGTLDSEVLTPFGFKLVKDLKLGDLVNNPDGSVAKIIQLHPIQYLPTYKVSFSDGTSTIVSKGHLWKAWRSGRFKKIKNAHIFGEESAEIIEVETLKEWTDRAKEQISKEQRPNWALIPVCVPQPFNASYRFPSDLDPYLLGTLLGDGTMKDNSILLTTIDYDHFKSEYDKLGLDYYESFQTLRFRGESRKYIENELKKLKILNTYANSKLIPRQYKYGSIEVRTAILQGLFDTDGTVSTELTDDERTGRNLSYTTVSKQLANDIKFIVQSLGGTVTITLKESPFYRDENGDKVHCQDAYVLYIKLPEPHKYFRMDRKIKLAETISEPNMCRRVVSVDLAGERWGRCITVSHPNGLYMTNDFIVTHNSFLMRYASILWASVIPGLQIFLFRRKYTDLEKNHLYGPTGYISLLDSLVQQKKVKINYSNLRIDFDNGSKIFLCHVNNDKDMFNYQGAEIHVLLIDELTHFTKEIYAFLRNRVRLSFKIDYEMLNKQFPWITKGYFPRILCGTNPGGVGHAFCKQMFVDSAPAGTIHKVAKSDGGMTRVYIPALIYENPFLLDEDPDYMERIRGLGDKHLVNAMLLGDWNILAGGALDDVWHHPTHVMEPFEIPRDWYIDRCFDWGSARPFACGWFAESNGNPVKLADGTERTFPRGTLFMIEELYGWNGNANEGSKLSTREQGYLIREVEESKPWGNRVRPGAADSSIFDKLYVEDDTESLHDHLVIGYNSYGIKKKKALAQAEKDEFKDLSYSPKYLKELFIRADKSPGSRVKGLELIRTYLKASSVSPMEDKGIFFFNNCIHTIRTLPVLPRDEKNIQDIDTNAEDHCVVGDTKVVTGNGIKHIKDLVGTNGKILSWDGQFHDYRDCRKTRIDTEVWSYEFTDGTKVECTPDHLVFTENGWKEIQDCNFDTKIIKRESIDLWMSKFYQKSNKSLMGRFTICVEAISKIMEKDFTELFGNFIMGKYLKGFTSIIKMRTKATTKLKILKLWIKLNTFDIMLQMLIIHQLLKKHKKPQKNGTKVMKDVHGIENNIKKIKLNYMLRKLKYVSSVAKNLRVLGIQNSVPITVNPNGDEAMGWIMSQRNVNIVGKNSSPINITTLNLVPDLVDDYMLHYVNIEQFKRIENQDTYCMNVPETECFVDVNGLVLHNCFDMIRYRVFRKQTQFTKLKVAGL